MENQENQGTDFEEAKVSTEKNVPRGSVEAVPIREAGIGVNSNHPRSITDDLLTNERRAHYGEDEVFKMHQGEPLPAVEQDVNQVESIAHLTRDNVIQGKFGSISGYGRHMCT